MDQKHRLRACLARAGPRRAKAAHYEQSHPTQLEACDWADKPLAPGQASPPAAQASCLPPLRQPRTLRSQTPEYSARLSNMASRPSFHTSIHHP